MREIGSKRLWSCALAIIVCVSGFQIGLCAQQTTRLTPKVMAVISAPPVEVKDDDPPLLKLKKQRFNAALSEIKDRADLYNRGLTRVNELIAVAERLFAAEVDLYDKPEEKTQVLQRQLDVYNEAQANLEKQVSDGLVPHADLERLLYDKLSVEMDLFNIKNAHDGHQ
jgi:hypothetical protein